VYIPVGRHLEKILPKKEIFHSGELNPIILTEVNSSQPTAMRALANVQHWL